jgi:pilus assembly protein FimV
MKPKLLTRLLAAAFFVATTTASAAGLGKLTVHSALGQPLSAEIDLVSVQKEELGTLNARVASPDTYQQAGIEYNSALPSVRLAIDKRPSGQHFIRVTSSQPVNEPFLDLVVELNSASGKLSREYTVLMDPPVAGRAEPVVAQSGKPKPAESVRAADKPVARPYAEATAATASGDTYGPVKAGDTLSGIARSISPGGASLEQTLVGLFRSNPDAFAGKNMNRLRTGKILRVPDRSELAAIDTNDAAKEVKLQAANWKAYRDQLAGAAPTVADETARQVATGRITARVEDEAAGKPAADVLKLSTADTGGAIKTAGVGGKGPKAAQERIKSLEEEITARDKALQEANERVAMLEKSVTDMQKLLAIKSPAGANMQVQAAAPAQPAEAPKAEASNAEAPKAEAPKAEAPPATESQPVEAVKAEEKAAPTVAEKPAPELAKPEQVAPSQPSAAAAPAPAVEPDMLDSILEEPLYLAGGVGVIALLVGLAVLSRRKNRSAEAREPEGASEATLGSALEKTLKQEAPAAPGPAPDEMAPVEEATKYLTLGRHAQAEEILNEALKTSPGQPALLLKLLEVHSSRNDRRAFQAVAGELLASTGGTGDIWIQAARLGFALDPQNSMYELGRAEADATPAVGVATSDLDFDLNVVAPKGPTETDIDVNARHGAAQFESTHLMTDEETRRIAGESSLTELTPPASPAGGSMAVTDFNLDAAGDAVSTNFSVDASQGGPSALDINFDLPPDELASAPGTTTSNDIKVDLKKPDSTPTSSDILDFDLTGISLDLDATATGIQSSVTGAVKDDHWFDVQTKFDLAKAYQEMGDKESAREILKEVLAEGDAQQQAEAKALLEALA